MKRYSDSFVIVEEVLVIISDIIRSNETTFFNVAEIDIDLWNIKKNFTSPDKINKIEKHCFG